MSAWRHYYQSLPPPTTTRALMSRACSQSPSIHCYSPSNYAIRIYIKGCGMGDTMLPTLVPLPLVLGRPNHMLPGPHNPVPLS